jgi:hypothetical protein
MPKTSKLLLLVPLLLPLPAQAVDAPADPPASVAARGNHLYLGVGMFSDMLNVNAEHVSGLGNFMLRLGQFRKGESMAANLSWRRHIDGLDGYQPGMYIGVFAGQVVNERINGADELRLGGGVEMGYHWVREYTRSELTVGMGAAEPLTVGTKEYKAEPTVFVSYTIALGN